MTASAPLTNLWKTPDSVAREPTTPTARPFQAIEGVMDVDSEGGKSCGMHECHHWQSSLTFLAACRTFPLAGRIAHRSWNLTV